MKTVSTSIIINAFPFEVWRVFSKFYAYELWNPFIQDVKGEVAIGERLSISLYPQFKQLQERMKQNHKAENTNFLEANTVKKATKHQVTVTELIENKRLRWHQKVFLMGEYDQLFTLAPYGYKNEQTKFTHTVGMSGFLINMGWNSYIKNIYQSGMELMNEALKKNVESGIIYTDEDLINYRK